MDKVIWMVSKLSMPCVLHSKSNISYVNSAFSHLLTAQDELSKLNFIQWLTKAIKNEKDAQLISEAIDNLQEIAMITDGVVKGTVFHWTIYSTPVPFQITNQKYQITWLQNSAGTNLNKSYWDLHLRVSKATMQLLQEISERKIAEEKAETLNTELIKAQQNLMVASHQAGMAEVAVSVLHNIGNVLNSVGISVEVMQNSLRGSIYKKISLVLDLLKSQESNMLDFFQNDERGKLLPKYLCALFEEIQTNKIKLEGEANRLHQQFDIIKNILDAQQDLANRQTITEKIFLEEIVDTSIQMILSEDSILTKGISFNKAYKYTAYIISDRTLVIQLIVILLKNAKESIEELKENTTRSITISTDRKQNSEYVELRIKDNGIGILPENLSKIFSFGFTTKPEGHGFGLHNGSLIAKQLGGTLSVESEGFCKGAEFILTLPIGNDRAI